MTVLMRHQGWPRWPISRDSTSATLEYLESAGSLRHSARFVSFVGLGEREGVCLEMGKICQWIISIDPPVLWSVVCAKAKVLVQQIAIDAVEQRLPNTLTALRNARAFGEGVSETVSNAGAAAASTRDSQSSSRNFKYRSESQSGSRGFVTEPTERNPYSI